MLSSHRQYVSSPMDLGEAETLMNEGSIHSVAKCFRTICKVFENAIKYNTAGKGKHGNVTIHDLAVELLHEVHKQKEETLQWIRNLYRIIYLKRNSGRGRARESTGYVLRIPDKCPNVSDELLDSLKLKQRLEGLLEVKHDRKKRPSSGDGDRTSAEKSKKLCTTSPAAPIPQDESCSNEQGPKLNSMNTAASSRRGSKHPTLKKQPSVRRVTLKLSTPAPHEDKLLSSSVEPPVQESLPTTEVSRTGINNTSAVRMGGTVTTESNIPISPTVPNHLPSSRPWIAAHLFEPPKGLNRQLEKWEVNCDKVCVITRT